MGVSTSNDRKVRTRVKIGMRLLRLVFGLVRFELGVGIRVSPYVPHLHWGRGVCVAR